MTECVSAEVQMRKECGCETIELDLQLRAAQITPVRSALQSGLDHHAIESGFNGVG